MLNKFWGAWPAMWSALCPGLAVVDALLGNWTWAFFMLALGVYFGVING